MELARPTESAIAPELIDAITSTPISREVSHCGKTFSVAPFDIYSTCPVCGGQVKVRAFGGGVEVEDVFDAVFAWMNKPGAEAAARLRRQVIAEDAE